MVARLRAFAASSDGSLLDDSTWSVRHRRITELCFGLATVVGLFAAFDRRDGWELFYPPVLLILLALASASWLPRRAREIATAATLIGIQVFFSRYVGNFTGLGAIAIIILSFYQDWVPILFSCAPAAAQIASAAIFPAWYQLNRGFQAEGPLTGMSLRALAIALAAALTLAVWRHGTQLARDQLTGMLSRAGAERSLDERIARGRRPVAWVCDLDNFVAVNAELGSEAGDRLLRHVAEQLKRVAGTL